MSKKVTKAIFPVAGLGTRFLPATKSIPKEIMTLVDRPLIQYAIDEARAAGIEEFIFVTSRGKSALEDYFDDAPELEASLEAKGKTRLLELLRQTSMPSGAIAYIRQHKALGLGHAVWCARRLIADEPFAVILPDDVIAADVPCLKQMVEAYARGGRLHGGGDGRARRSRPAPTACLTWTRRAAIWSRSAAMVEKPAAGTAPSNLAVIGRYILTPRVLSFLDRQTTGAGGEIQLTDAIASEIAKAASRPRPAVRGPAVRLRLEGGLPAGDGGLRAGARGPARRVRRLSRRHFGGPERRRIDGAPQGPPHKTTVPRTVVVVGVRRA